MRIHQNNFLLLSEALEKDQITVEEFQTLLKSGLYEGDLKAIIQILNMDGVQKERLLPRLLELSPYVSPSAFAAIFSTYPIYCSDIERQEYLFNSRNFIHILKIAPFLTIDELWQNRSLLNPILDPSFDGDIAGLFKEYSKSYEFIQKYHPDCISYLHPALELQNEYDMIYYLQCLRIDGLYQNLIWFEQIFQKYERTPSYTGMRNNYFYSFDSLEELDVMDALNKIVLTIQKKKEEEISACFDCFFANVHLLTSSLKKEENCLFQDDLITASFYFSNSDFGTAIKIITGFENKKEIYEAVFKIQNRQVREKVVNALLSKVITKEEIPIYETLDYDATNLLLTKKKFEMGNLDLLKDDIQYYGFALPDYFWTFIEQGNMTKEDILKVRNLLNGMPKDFQDEHFIIDIDSIIPEEFRVIEEKEEISEEVLEEMPAEIPEKTPIKQKKISFLDRFKKRR